MPEYMTTGSPSQRMAGNVVQWLSDPETLADNVRRLDQLAKKYATPGATERAAEYLLETLGVVKAAELKDAA